MTVLQPIIRTKLMSQAQRHIGRKEEEKTYQYHQVNPDRAACSEQERGMKEEGRLRGWLVRPVGILRCGLILGLDNRALRLPICWAGSGNSAEK